MPESPLPPSRDS